MYIEFILNFVTALLVWAERLSILLVLVVGYFFAQGKFKFQSLHKRRFEVLEEAYEKIKLASASYRSFLETPPTAEDCTSEKEAKDLTTKINNMIQFLDTKRLFFSKKEKVIIDVLIKTISESWCNYTEKSMIKNDKLFSLKERIEALEKAYGDVDKEIPKLVDQLEKTFKKVLGL